MGKDRAEGSGVSLRSERARGVGLARRTRTSRIDLVRHDVGVYLEDRLVIHDHLRSCRPCGGGEQQGGRAQQKYDIEREWGLAGRMKGWFPVELWWYKAIEGFGEASKCKLCIEFSTTRARTSLLKFPGSEVASLPGDAKHHGVFSARPTDVLGGMMDQRFFEKEKNSAHPDAERVVIGCFGTPHHLLRGLWYTPG